MMNLQLIVNADDLGASDSVNDSVFELAARGVVTSATILANAPAIDHALNAAKRVPTVSFGVHLNLTEFEPLSRSAKLRPLLDSAGCFSRSAVRSVSLDAELRDAIFEEWCEQVGRVSAVLPVSHFDSHHHVHTIPGLFFVLKRLQRHFGIRRVRLTKNLFARPGDYDAAHLLKKAIWNASLRRLYSTRTTRAFASLEEFEDLHRRGELRRWLWSLPLSRSIVEVMVNPGNPQFSTENRLLYSTWLNDQSFKLVNYASI